jgi:hypothetical protein
LSEKIEKNFVKRIAHARTSTGASGGKSGARE